MLNNMTMRNRLLLILALPFAGLLFFSINSAIEKAQVSRNMQNIEMLVGLSAKLGAAAHELQKERGMTGGFLGSKGQKFAAELPAQRKEADKRLAELKETLKGFDKSHHDSALVRTLDEAMRYLDDLNAKRDAVSGFSIAGAEALGYYTRTVGAMLLIARQTMLHTDDSRLTRLAASYSNLSHVKERAGIERAVLTNVFAAGKFNPDLLARFLTNDAAQDVYLLEFQATASAPQQEFYKQKLAGHATEETARMKKIALEGVDGRKLGVDADHWFTTITGKINLLKEVEDTLAGDFLAAAESLKGAAVRTLYLFLAATVIALAATGLLAYYTIRNILRQLGGEPVYAVEIAGKISSGDLTTKIETAPGDTHSVIAAFKTMQSKMAANLAAEVKVQEEINALVNAAASGDLTKRVALEDKQGFMRKLGEGMNELLEVLAAAMDDIARALDGMAKGDLTVSISKEYRGTFGKLKDDINATVAKLTEVVSSIKEAVDLIKTASMEVSMGNSNLSQRTQEQASALEETASSMEEMTSTVKQNADNAKQANQLVSGARTQAAEGGEVVTKAIGAMEAISGSSKKIADIISVIDEIAFQTNLLALNAAVEAARAGEQGRGFAVVATEVRNLAQRSAEAAKEIKDLINDSVEKVGTGSKLVDSSGNVLSEIVGSVKKISDIVAEISAASQEQASGIEQVNKAVMQMDEMTQQNAALVEQAAAASKSVEDQAVNLSEQVAFFHINDAGKTIKDSPRKPVIVSTASGHAREKGNGGSHLAKKVAAIPKVAAGGKAAPIPSHLAAKPGSGSGESEKDWDEF